MIFGVSGIPGSGKSFYIVHWLLENYFDKDGLPLKDYTIISNVEGLLLDHIPLDDILRDVSHEQFFTVPYQEKVSKKYSNIIYIIDECQRFFPRFMKNRDICYYFEYHRHLGHVICLATQNFRSRVSPEIAALLEYEIRAVPRSLSIGGTFRYFRIVNQDKVGTFFLRPSSKIFRLYKSANSFKGENKHIKKPMMIPLFVAISIFFISGFLFYKHWYVNPKKKLSSPISAVHSSTPRGQGSPLPTSGSSIPVSGQGSPLPASGSSFSAQSSTSADRPHMIDDDPSGFWVELPYMMAHGYYFIVDRGSGRLVELSTLPFPVRTGRRGHRIIIEGKVDDRYLAFLPDHERSAGYSDRSTAFGHPSL